MLDKLGLMLVFTAMCCGLLSCSASTNTTNNASTAMVYDRSKDFRSTDVAISDTFSNTSRFIGAEAFLQWDDTTDILVKILEIAFMRDELGMVVVSKFNGTTTWGSQTIKGIQYDRDSALQSQGYRPTSNFESAHLLDSAFQPTVQSGQVKFRTAAVNGHTLLCLSNFNGKHNGNVLSFELTLPSTCLGVLMFDCVNLQACGGLCPKIRTSDYWNTTTCNCPGIGGCYLSPDGTVCVTTSCTSACHNYFGWSAYCLCY